MRQSYVSTIWVFLFFALVLGLGIGPQSLLAEEELNETPEFYRYKHEDGTVVFTDDPLKIPEEYRKSASQVELPPLVTIPAPRPMPQAKGPSRISQLKIWYGNLSPCPWRTRRRPGSPSPGWGGALPICQY